MFDLGFIAPKNMLSYPENIDYRLFVVSGILLE